MADLLNPQIISLMKRAQTWIDAHKSEFISEIQLLSRVPSVSRADLAEPGAPFGPECRRMLDLALERGRHFGFNTIDHDGYAGSIYCGDFENSLGIIGHLDVVPVSDGWIYPPFGATYLPEHDALVGRGVDDNKGPTVAGLFAMRMLREFEWPLRHGLRLICGLSEETGMQDMAELKKRSVPFPHTSLVPDSGFPVNYGQKGSLGAEIAAECTGNLKAFDAGTVRNVVPDKASCILDMDINTAKAGLILIDPELQKNLAIQSCEGGVCISAAGKSAHAAFPDGGINAIQLLCRALTQSKLLSGSCRDAIRELSELTSDAHGISEGVEFEDDISGKLTLVYGVAHLKDDRLTVSVDCRSPITIDQQWLADSLMANWAQRGFIPNRLNVNKPFYIPKDDPRVTALQQLYEQATGRNEQPFTMGGGTYSRVAPDAISFGAGMPGPNRTSDFMPEGHGGAHGLDETLCMEKVYNCARIYVAALALLDQIVD